MIYHIACAAPVYDYFSPWSKEGTWQWIQSEFVKKIRPGGEP